MKSKIVASNNILEKQSLVELAPKSWSLKQVMDNFGVSNRMARFGRNTNERLGDETGEKKGRSIDNDIISRVKDFYQCDEVSRMCPGKRDFISIKENGLKVHKQKYLLLANISEIYVLYKEKYPEDKIGISKFYQLRPPWCVTIGASGMHNVCVCVTHQNIKLLLYS